MPFTPFHIGPGLLIKALLQGSFSLTVFAWCQVLIDLQPLIVMLGGAGELHGFSHTWLGAGLIGLTAGLSGKYVAGYGLRMIGLTRNLPIAWKNALLSAFIGAFSHVLLDSMIYADMHPLSPFSPLQPLLGIISIDALYDLCLYSGLIGAALYLGITYSLSRRGTPRPTDAKE